MVAADRAEIEGEFLKRVARIVWCTLATVDRAGRPRTRIVHPVWEGMTGWLLTNRDSLKVKHLAVNPHASLTYWDPQHETAAVECITDWCEDLAERRRLWEFFRATPPPLGYDPGAIWKAPDDANLGVLRLTPWRIELRTPSATALDRKVWQRDRT